MDQVLELKNIHYAYHNPDGETPAINGISMGNTFTKAPQM